VTETEWGGLIKLKTLCKMTSIVWHELTHASQLTRMKTDKNLLWASDYWSKVVYQQAKNELSAGSPYGKKGDSNWQRIALTEGWANYRQEDLTRRYLPKKNPTDPDYVATNRPLLYPFLVMSRNLKSIGCSYTEMEKALCNHTVDGFKNYLVSKYPSKKSNIEKYVTDAYNNAK